MMKLKFDQSIFLGGKGSPFLKFVVSIWARPVGGGVDACLDGSEHFCSTSK